jgi:hypothetical protein
MNYRILVERSVAEMDLPGDSAVGYDAIAHQTLVESNMLKHLTDGLRSTIAWPVQGAEATRKLSTLRFILQSFQRHLEHLMTLEENDGYMDLVEENAPQLFKTVRSLRREHDCLRSDLRRLVQNVENLCAVDSSAFDQTCLDLLDYLHRLEDHSAHEVSVLQEAFDHDTGGEG